MTREKAKEICEMIETHGIEVIKAYGEGKIIQHLNLDGEWTDCDMPISFVNNHSFRVKPELKEIKEKMTKEDYDIEVAKEYTTLQERIATLEKENKVLAQNLEDTEILNKTYEKRFSDLEKENAELKLKLEALEGQTPWKDIKDKSEVIEQLTKAKEIIKGLLPMASNFVFGTLPKLDEEVQLYKQAEQFLNSEVEK